MVGPQNLCAVRKEVLVARTLRICSIIGEFLFSRSKRTSGLLALGLLAVIGYLDYITGFEVLLTIFYLLPISILAWSAGTEAGIAMAIISEITETATNLVWTFTAKGLDSRHLALIAWNTAVKMIVFMIFAYALSKLKEAHDKQTALNRELEARASELQTAYKDMEFFSCAASHDLRSPLIPIEGFSRILREEYGDRLDEKANDLLCRIGDSARKMSRLIEDLLSFFSLRGKEVRKTEFDIKEVLMNVFEDLPVPCERKIEFEIADPPEAYGDPAMVRQVIANLLSNAVKFTGTRHRAVIEAGGYAEGEENVYFIRDNGVGFDTELKTKLFTPFQRLHSPKEFSGTGIGLALARRIIEKHGGRTWAESRPGDGATFYFTLPKKNSG